MEIKNYTNYKTIRLNQKKTQCPTCKKKSREPYRPFCSSKCSDIDLMKWLSDENFINLDKN